MLPRRSLAGYANSANPVSAARQFPPVLSNFESETSVMIFATTGQSVQVLDLAQEERRA